MLDRYILRKMLAPLLLGLGIFTTLGLVIGTLFDLVRKVTDSGLAIGTAGQMLWLQTPRFLVMALPMAVLLATLMTYSQLSRNSELIALRGFGIGPVRLVRPAVLLGLLVMTTAFIFNEFLVPSANYQAALTINQALQQPSTPYQDRNIFYREFKSNRLSQMFFARQFDGQSMYGLTLITFSPDGLSQIMAAEQANWNSSRQSWDFYRGTVYDLTADNSYRQIKPFEHQVVAQLPRTPLDLATENRKYDQMNIGHTRQVLRLVTTSGDTKRLQRLRLHLQKKYALPSVPLVFALIGACLGMATRQRATSGGFTLSVVIIFGYYILSYITDSLGAGGLISGAMAAWLPTCVGLALGGTLLMRISQ